MWREAAISGHLARERRDHQVVRALEQSSRLLKGYERAEAANAAVICALSGTEPCLPAGSRFKRLIDVAGASFGLVFLAPFLLLVALLIRLESPGPALFRQRRKGRGGVPFAIYKFRTMRCLEDGPEIRQAERGDHRTTWLGAFLRRSSIDELPQLLNVLKGDMSLVGPRPHALAHDEFYGAAIENYDARFLARPGISGLAQVSGLRGPTPNIEWMAARVALDLKYIRNWSVGLDLRILLQTFVVGPFDPAAF
jgi:putative colanic acid biosysnthesis UDP-glucose lipid carrier transferase